MNITRREFVRRLLDEAERSVLHIAPDFQTGPDIWKAYKLGIADTEDLRAPDGTVHRSDAARISHMYMKKILHIPDIPDISEAEVLKDLYDCRVCTNHIAQVFLRGIMEGKDMPGARGRVFLAFDLGAPVDEAEAENIITLLVKMTR